VHLLDGTWPPGRLAALMAASGCYVSLHRSEGLGMTMAEAMWLGKPVVATAYSGNMDFMDEDTAFLVPFDRVAIPEGCEPYPAGTPWAEPDLDRAAELLRRVFEDPAEAGRRAARGRERLAADFSAHRCGLRMQARMREIRAGR
jgi:glycosyltransferase involved in cell wall biosynthesis